MLKNATYGFHHYVLQVSLTIHKGTSLLLSTNVCICAHVCAGTPGSAHARAHLWKWSAYRHSVTPIHIEPYIHLKPPFNICGKLLSSKYYSIFLIFSLQEAFAYCWYFKFVTSLQKSQIQMEPWKKYRLHVMYAPMQPWWPASAP